MKRRRMLWAGMLAACVVLLVAGAVFTEWYVHRNASLIAPVQKALVPASTPQGVDFAVVGAGFTQLTDIQFLPGSRMTAVLLEKQGTARLARLKSEEGKTLAANDCPTLFEVDVRSDSELGLLGLAFHPKYEENSLVYVNYNPKAGPLRTRISEWILPRDDLGRRRAVERRVLLEVDQPYANHDGGGLAFGPDGMLYIGLGDGGSGGDPEGHGQNLRTLLGTMLRIDVDAREGGRAYGIPKDNPFVDRAGARPEIWAYGLRNPWRFSFDARGRLIVADVGQNEYEEVDLVAAGDNLGWKVREGRHCFPPGSACERRGLVDPIFEYGRDLGTSITGGYVYTGSALPGLRERYIVGDFGSGRVWALELPASRSDQARVTLLGKWPRAFSTFGRDEGGELYAADYSSGELLRMVAR